MTYVLASGQPFDVLRSTLRALTTGPDQATLDTARVEDIDAKRLTASQVLDLLQDAPRLDGLWHAVFARARAGEPTWTVITIGGMLPSLITYCHRYARVPERHMADMEAELLTTLMEQVRSMPAQVGGVQHRLWSAVANTANRFRYQQVRDARARASWDPSMVANLPHRGRGPVTVLAETVSEGVVTSMEAELIARTRLEHSTLTRVAEELGLTYITARRWRRAAEERLAAALVRKESSIAMSDIGT